MMYHDVYRPPLWLKLEELQINITKNLYLYSLNKKIEQLENIIELLYKEKDQNIKENLILI